MTCRLMIANCNMLSDVYANVIRFEYLASTRGMSVFTVYSFVSWENTQVDQIHMYLVHRYR